MTPGKFLLVFVSNDKKSGASAKWNFQRGLKFLHIPDRFSTLQCRKVLLKSTSKWANQPSDAVLGILAEKTVAFSGSEAGQEAELRTFCQKVYRVGVARLREKNGLGDKDFIPWEDVHVKVQDWRDVFNKMVGSGAKWGEEGDGLAVQTDKVDTVMQNTGGWVELETSASFKKKEALQPASCRTS